MIIEIAEASRGVAAGPHTGGGGASLDPPAARVNILTHVRLWPTDKTQSLMKKEDQQKFLDKVLTVLWKILKKLGSGENKNKLRTVYPKHHEKLYWLL